MKAESARTRIEQYLQNAILHQASDIHIDPTEDMVNIRFRIDGLLKVYDSFPRSSHAEVIARLKILSGLRTDEHHAAQDGRFMFDAAGTRIDIRISIIPTYYGENAVLRLLSQDTANFSLESLGFSSAQKALLRESIARTSGMILVTGPTGSGKTTTLYTLLSMLSEEPLSLVSIEDPIEYSIPRIRQIPVHAKRGLTFAEGLRSILRQDPDVIMVGEIRDSATAGIAINAALTGHLVLSTLHTNTADAALPRLLDLGVPEYLIRATVRLVLAQRLVRKLCSECRIEGIAEYIAAGCASCDNSGYRGRVGIYELLTCSPEGSTSLLSFAEDAEQKIREGQTTRSEYLRSAYV